VASQHTHSGARDLAFTLNGSPLAWPLDAPAASNEVGITAFLPGGINSIRLNIRPELAIESLDLSPAHGSLAAYDTPARSNSNGIAFEDISVPAPGTYNLIVTYANGDHAHGGQIEDHADIVVNDGLAKPYYFKNTFDTNAYRTTVIPVTLLQGRNAIRFAPGAAG
jgi:hypothetical protein